MCVGILAGCITTPSSLSDLGEETATEKVVGSATYVGFFGFSVDAKEEVYEQALKNALSAAPAGTRALEDVKLWETRYVSANVGLSLVVALPTALSLVMGDPDQMETSLPIFESLVTIIATGLEVTKFTVVGVPVPIE